MTKTIKHRGRQTTQKTLEHRHAYHTVNQNELQNNSN